MKKKNVKVDIRQKLYELGIDVPFLNCSGEEYTIEEMIEQLNRAKELIDIQGFTNVSIKIDSGYEDVSLEIFAERPETDAEYNRRMTLAQKRRESNKIRLEKEHARLEQERIEKENQERKLLSELKKKYEATTR